jgi:hypothetical protein
MAAVGLGWDRAFGEMDDMGEIDRKTALWVDVDEKGSVIPEWVAFEMF